MNTAEQYQEAVRRDAEREMWREKARKEFAATREAGTHREEGVELWAHCPDAVTCDDAQERIVGVRITTNQTYRENGGDGMMADRVERSFTDLDFANDEDRQCKRCGLPRHLTDQERKSYPPLSGKDPQELLRIARWLKDNGGLPATAEGAVIPGAPPEDDRVATLEKELADLKAAVQDRLAPEANVEGPEASSEATGGLRGYRERNGRYEAIIYRSESKDGRQHGVGTFDTPEEALTAREAWLS